MRLVLASFASLVLAGCGGSVVSVGGEDASISDAGDAASVDAIAIDAAPIDASVLCPWEHGDPHEPSVSYEKRCATVADCAIGFHLANCCGQKIALGVAAVEALRFARDGGICGDEYPTCKCLAGGTLAEDGKISTKPNGADIALACVAGACTTHIAP